ncbi:MAG: hypothetical protein WBF67_01950, partial [Olleya sp.]
PLNSMISIIIEEKNSTLTCICRNDFESKNTDATEFKIGLKNLQKRLDLLYPNKHEFTIKNSNQFEVILILDLS